VAAEEPDCAAFVKERPDVLTRPDDAAWPSWSGSLQVAWDALRDDRHYGAMGGLGRIHFAAIDHYAARFGIDGAAFGEFAALIRALDDEYIALTLEEQKRARPTTEQE